MDAADKRMLEREALRNMIQQWNANRLDLFELSEPNENLEFHGVMRFYFQDSGQKIATKCIRVASDATVSDVIETLIEKFRPDMRMLSLGSYSLWETHGPDDERKLEPHEKPLLVQLNWHADDREGRFLLKCLSNNEVPVSEKGDQNFKRKLSKREKKELKKKEKLSRLKSDTNDENRPVAEKLYTELPETSFTRSISNPEAVMRRRRQQKLERKLQQFRSKDGGPDTGGTLKIYGSSLSPDVPYKTLLLSISDTASGVVRETLDKYGLSRHDPYQYCIVQVDTADNSEYILEDDECPLAIVMTHQHRRAADDQLTRTPGGVSEQMGNAATTRPSQYNDDKDGSADQPPSEEISFRRASSDPKMAKKKCCGKGCCPPGCCGKEWWLKALLYLLTIATAIVALVVLVLSVSSAIATKIYSSDLSGRIVGLVILAVTAAGTITVLIVLSVYYFKKKYKVMNSILSVLLVLAVIQSILAGVAVKVTQKNEITLTRSLIESFRQARESNPRHVKLWADTQSGVNCCGVYSAEDYRRPGIPPYFPPDIPISCCPSYDSKRSDLAQERNREICKSRGTFYREGCKGPVLVVFKASSQWVLVAVIVLIILEVLVVAVAVTLMFNKKSGPKKSNPEDGHKDKPDNEKEKDKNKEKEKDKNKEKEKEKHKEKEKDKDHGKK